MYIKIKFNLRAIYAISFNHKSYKIFTIINSFYIQDFKRARNWGWLFFG